MKSEIRVLSIPENFKEWGLLDLFVKSCNGYLALVDLGESKYMMCYDYDWYYLAAQWFERMGYERP